MWTLNTLARSTAIVLSITAGVISVIGLANIFSGAWAAVIVVASVLELAKVVTAAWLDVYWKTLRLQLKIYLSTAVFVLMCITSLGIYGFFARSHVEQIATLQSGDQSKLPVMQLKIEQKKQEIADIDKQISTIDSTIGAIAVGKSREAEKALQANDKQRSGRQKLVADKTKLTGELVELQQQKIAIDNTVRKQEVEVGPLKYIAGIFYDTVDLHRVEQAVQLLILTLMFAFDPLAIALLIGSNSDRSSKANLVSSTRYKKISALAGTNPKNITSLVIKPQPGIKKPVIVKRKKTPRRVLDLSKANLIKK
jgi:hypothetical protein